MARKKTSTRTERDRGYIIDNMVTYLECSDFRPPVKTFFPLIEEMLRNTYDLAARLSAGGHDPIQEPVGLIGGADDRKRYVFRVDCCWPASRPRVANTIRIAGGDCTLPADAILAKVAKYQIAADGRVSGGFPQYVYTSSTLDRDMWFPVVTPTSGGRVVRRTGGSGERGSYAEYREHVGGDIGLLPYAAGIWNRVLQQCWSVSIQADNGASRLLFFTNEEGVKGFWDLRNAPMASSRKAALQHFVRAHIRQPKPSSVRCHFRGKEEFTWFGLNCRVEPPSGLREQVESVQP